MILRTEVSDADVGTASKGLLGPAASLANRVIETFCRCTDLCRHPPFAPVVTRGVSVLQDALTAAHFWWQLDTHLLDTIPLRDVEGKCLGNPQPGWPNSKLV